MPYRCVHCSAIHQDGSKDILTGCSSCGSKFFFYIRADKLKEISENKELETDFSPVEKKQMEEDVREIVGLKNEETPIFLDFESVKIIKPGKYVLDLSKLFSKDKPQVYKLEDGKYIIDLNAKTPAEQKNES